MSHQLQAGLPWGVPYKQSQGVARSPTLCWLALSCCADGGVQGVLQLLEKAEIRDVLATAGLQFEQLKRMGRFGGVVLQLQGMVQKGSTKVGPLCLMLCKMHMLCPCSPHSDGRQLQHTVLAATGDKWLGDAVLQVSREVAFL